MDLSRRHPDVLTAREAVEYLRLDSVAPSPESALGILARLTRQGRLHPIRWAKEHLYAKPDLDRFVAETIADLDGHHGPDHLNGQRADSGGDRGSIGDPKTTRRPAGRPDPPRAGPANRRLAEP